MLMIFHIGVLVHFHSVNSNLKNHQNWSKNLKMLAFRELEIPPKFFYFYLIENGSLCMVVELASL